MTEQEQQAVEQYKGLRLSEADISLVCFRAAADDEPSYERHVADAQHAKMAVVLAAMERERDALRLESEARLGLMRRVSALVAERDQRIERLERVLDIDLDTVGRIMHESWSKTKRAQGFHLPTEGHPIDPYAARMGDDFLNMMFVCAKCHVDLIPWEQLTEGQRDINRHAFDAVLSALRQRAALHHEPAQPHGTEA